MSTTSQSSDKRLGIEIMPVEKSCEQGCAHCPLSSKNKPVTAQEIDPQVQTTFSQLEEYLQHHHQRYDMHFSSQLELFPLLQYPDLIDMVRFETSRQIRNPGKAAIFTEKVKQLITTHQIDPQHICFSYVPSSLILDPTETALVASIMQQMSQWFFVHQSDKKISCTVRSNFVPEKKYVTLDEEVDHQVLTATLRKLLPIADDTSLTIDQQSGEDTFVKLYRKELSSKSPEGNTFAISNRVIVHKKITKQIEETFLATHEGKLDVYTEQAIKGSIRGLGVLISPEGVMLNHSSDAINNPMFWLAHEDFAYVLTHYATTDIPSLIDQIFLQNQVLYRMIEHYLAVGFNRDDLSKSDYLGFFTEMRPQLITYLAKEQETNPQVATAPIETATEA